MRRQPVRTRSELVYPMGYVQGKHKTSYQILYDDKKHGQCGSFTYANNVDTNSPYQTFTYRLKTWKARVEIELAMAHCV